MKTGRVCLPAGLWSGVGGQGVGPVGPANARLWLWGWSSPGGSLGPLFTGWGSQFPRFVVTQRRRVNCSKTCHTRGWHQPPRVSQARSPSGRRGGPPAPPPRPRPRTQPPAEPRLLARRPSCPRLSPPCPGGRLHQAPQTPARTAQPLPSSSSPAVSPAAQGRTSLSTLRVMGVVARGGPGILQPVGNFRQRKGRLDEPLGTAGPRGGGGRGRTPSAPWGARWPLQPSRPAPSSRLHVEECPSSRAGHRPLRPQHPCLSSRAWAGDEIPRGASCPHLRSPKRIPRLQ